MPISYKNKIYTTLGTPTSVSGNGTFVTNSAGVPAKDYTVKGKTIIWNQMVQNPNFSNTVVDTLTHVSFRVQQMASPYDSFLGPELQEPGAVSAVFTIPVSGNCRIKHNGSAHDIDFCYFTSVKDHKYYIYFNFTSTNPSVAGGVVYNKAQLFDLTQMFGAGNEPSTPAEFKAMFPDDYYSYNAGELKTITPTSIQASGVERFQMLDKSKYPATTTINGVTFTNNGDGTITANGTATDRATLALNDRNTPMVRGKGFIVGDPEVGSAFINYDIYDRKGIWLVDNASYGGKGKIFTMREEAAYGIVYIAIEAGTSANNLVFKPQLFDLTQMFGAGNEPATPEEFWQKVPEKLYGYNPNDYKSANIPSVKYLPDGMRSAGSAYDEINFLSQKAIKRVGTVDMGTLNWSYSTTRTAFQTDDLNTKIEFPVTSSDTANLICTKYSAESYASGWSRTIDKCCGTTFATAIKWFWVRDTAYTDPAAFKSAMSGVMLYYELATPVETAITPSLQALSTYKGFNSFSAPNSLMQNGPLSVTYYVEGGANPEKGWLTSYKRKLYMGRNIEWNQLFDKSKFHATQTDAGITIKNNGDGTFTINGTREAGGGTVWYTLYVNTENVSLAKKLYGHKILYGCVQNPSSGSTNNDWGICYEINDNMSNGAFTKSNLGESAVIATLNKVSASNITGAEFYFYFRPSTSGAAVYKDVIVRPQLFDLTQMFGAGNEPSTPEEFWSYFDHKLYPYNAGETQPLFKISRKSQWGSVVSYPNKGDLINIEGKQYRVLKTNGNIAEVLCMYDASSSVAFDTNSSNTYAGSNIDTYCNNTFYSGGLSPTIKDAIVDKTFTQDSWNIYFDAVTEPHYTGKDTNGELYYLVLNNTAYGTSITRHCYCLSIQDTLDYLECTISMDASDTTLTGTNVLQIFSSQSGKDIWLRSAASFDSSYAFVARSRLGNRTVNGKYAVRPAFQIDLSKVAWTKQG